jgi:hypothetical protein
MTLWSSMPPSLFDVSGTAMFDIASNLIDSAGGNFGIAQLPSNSLAVINGIIVNPADFQDGAHVLIKQEFVLTAKYATYISPGTSF